MKKQNTSGLYLPIQKIGCFFISACDLAQMEAEKRGWIKKELSVPELNYIWEQALAFKYINAEREYRMENSAGVATLAARALKLPVRFVEVATVTGPEVYWYAPADKRRADYFIEKIKQNGPSKTHFRVVNVNGELLEDPHEPEITSRGSIHTICYRMDEVEK